MGQAYPRHTDHRDSNTSLAVLTFTKCSFSSKAKSWDSRQSQDHGETVDGSVSGPPPHHGPRCRSSLKVAFRPRRNKTSAVPYRGAAHVPTNARPSAHQHHPRLLVRYKLWVQEWQSSAAVENPCDSNAWGRKHCLGMVCLNMMLPSGVTSRQSPLPALRLANSNPLTAATQLGTTHGGYCDAGCGLQAKPIPESDQDGIGALTESRPHLQNCSGSASDEG